jgi:colicin import membrane protein
MRPTRKGEKAGPGPGGIWKPGFLSLVIHLLLLAAVSLGMNGIGTGTRPDVIRLVSIVPGGGGAAGPPGGPAAGPPAKAPPAPAVKEAGPEKGPAPEAPKPKADEVERPTGRKKKPPKEKAEPVVRERPKEIPEGLKPSRKPQDEAKRKREEEAKREKEEKSAKDLLAAIEEIRRKAALNEIEKRVTEKERRRRPETSPAQDPVRERPAVGPVAPSSTTTSPWGSGTAGSGGSGSGGGGPGGTGRGGRGGSGSGEGGPGGPGFGPGGGTKQEEYYSLVWARIQEEWTLPESLPKARDQLETIVVVILSRDGRVQRSWIEKPSGQTLYDQAVMRAVKKAEPFPPFPREITESSLEIEFHFRPDR